MEHMIIENTRIFFSEGGKTPPFCPTLGPTFVASSFLENFFFTASHMSAIMLRSDSYILSSGDRCLFLLCGLFQLFWSSAC